MNFSPLKSGIPETNQPDSIKKRAALIGGSPFMYLDQNGRSLNSSISGGISSRVVWEGIF
jgi:hypothetical protein